MFVKGKGFLLLFQLLFCCNIFSQAELDLSSWNNRQNVISLDNKWEFYWNKFYFPEDFKRSTLIPDSVLVPTSWGNTGFPSQGFATYRMRIKNIPDGALMLNFYSVQTSGRIFFDDSLVVEVGYPSIDKQTTRPANKDIQILLPAGKKEIQLIVHVANFHHRKGGFVSPPEIGKADLLIRQRMVSSILDFVESSALMIIGLFLLALFIFRRKDLSVLYFALFCITLSFRPVISVNYLLAYLFEDFSWSLLLRIEYLAVMFPCLFMLLFIKKLYTEHLPLLLVRSFLVVFLTMIFITVFFPPDVFSWLVPVLLFIIPAGVIVFIITILKAIISKVDGAMYAGAGIIILLSSLLLKVLVYAGILYPVHILITIMDIAFIFSMSLILGSRFSLQFVKVETLQKQTEAQHQEIEIKKVQLEQQNKMMEEKNKEILDSITYARRIQSAILPPKKLILQHFPESFIFYKPKDIVAGDFYWFEASGSKVIFAAADCTGHGVPGAMISVVCNNALNRSVREFGLMKPGDILTKTRELIIEQFNKNDEDVKDGMDIALCSFDTNTFELEYSGANNNLYLIENGKLVEIKADKQPVGNYSEKKDFITHTRKVEKGTGIYIFSDGYADQFGGKGGKKLKTSGFKELLMNIQSLPMSEQESVIEKMFISWKGSYEQLDDVLVIGVNI